MLFDILRRIIICKIFIFLDASEHDNRDNDAHIDQAFNRLTNQGI